MTNPSRLIRGGQAEQSYRANRCESLDKALDDLAADPIGPHIASFDRPPAVIYRYRDNGWEVYFGRSYSLTEERYILALYAINPR